MESTSERERKKERERERERESEIARVVFRKKTDGQTNRSDKGFTAVT